MRVLLQKERSMVSSHLKSDYTSVVLKTEDSKNMSIKSKRLVAAWDNEFLLKILRKTR